MRLSEYAPIPVNPLHRRNGRVIGLPTKHRSAIIENHQSLKPNIALCDCICVFADGQSSAASPCTLSYLKIPGRASFQYTHLSPASTSALPRSQRERAHSGTYEDAEIVVLARTADTAQRLSLFETRDAADILG